MRACGTRASSSLRSLHYCRLPLSPSIMKKLLTVVLVSSLLILATLADDASSRSSLHSSSLDTQRGHALGRKGKEEPVHKYSRREGELKEQHEVAASAAMQVKSDAEREGGWTEEDEDAGAGRAEGPLIYSTDYSGVAMHDRGSPPAHKKHPKVPKP